MSDLSGSGVTPGSRRPMGRAKLQSELAAHRGTFFTSVLTQMARRMNPTSSMESSPKVLLERGVSGVKYLERFGGYGKQRDLGCLQFQVMQIFDYLMDENLLAARRLGGALGHHPGADERGRRTAGPCSRGLPSRRPAGFDLPDEALELHKQKPSFCTTSRPKASHCGAGIPEGARHNPKQASGTCRCP